MKGTIKYLSVLIMIFGICSFLEASVADEFLALGTDYSKTHALQLSESVRQEKILLEKENFLSEKLLSSSEEIELLTKNSKAIEKGMLQRLIQRVAFKVNLEKRSDLAGCLSSLQIASKINKNDLRDRKKIANIGGRQVDLLDGEWNTTPDGKQYWVSNEYSDIILSAAEYRRYAATAVNEDD
ncbi:MAG: hypothetical protein HQM08_20815 [Candidatus Riflebacteria bacterium]|nr:hypothetical protein [Candidatus Riflebacteria bacterium]